MKCEKRKLSKKEKKWVKCYERNEMKAKEETEKKKEKYEMWKGMLVFNLSAIDEKKKRLGEEK